MCSNSMRYKLSSCISSWYKEGQTCICSSFLLSTTGLICQLQMCTTGYLASPPLMSWAELHLTAITSAQTHSNFSSAFDNFISQDVSILLNGAPLTRAQYEIELLGTVNPEEAAVFDIQNIVSVAHQNTNISNSSVVCLSYGLSVIPHVDVCVRSMGWLEYSSS